MAISYEFESAETCLFVTVRGQWERDGLLSLIDAIVARCREDGLDRTLVDSRGLDGSPHELDRYLIGEHVAKVGMGIRFAAVWRAGQITHLTEDVVSSRGGILLVTAELTEALAFLQVSAKSERLA